MKLDRNINPDKRGKYALVKIRTLAPLMAESPTVRGAVQILEDLGVIDYGSTMDDEFFVIRCRDKYAAPALRAYANAARADDPEWAFEVDVIAVNAETHPAKQKPS